MRLFFRSNYSKLKVSSHTFHRLILTPFQDQVNSEARNKGGKDFNLYSLFYQLITCCVEYIFIIFLSQISAVLIYDINFTNAMNSDVILKAIVSSMLLNN